jgi:hypothetical protein
MEEKIGGVCEIEESGRGKHVVHQEMMMMNSGKLIMQICTLF